MNRQKVIGYFFLLFSAYLVLVSLISIVTSAFSFSNIAPEFYIIIGYLLMLVGFWFYIGGKNIRRIFRF